MDEPQHNPKRKKSPLYPVEPTYTIFTEKNYREELIEDFNNAKALIILQSPYITVAGVQRLSGQITKFVRNGGRLCSLLLEPKEWQKQMDPSADPGKLKQFQAGIEYLESLGSHINLRKKIHAKITVIDNSIVWDGSLNYLSYYDTTESITRWRGRSIVAKAIANHNLVCETCVANLGYSVFSPPDREIEAMLIGQRIAERRISLGLSQEDVAKMAGSTQRTVSGLESGTIDVRVSTYRRIIRSIELESPLLDRIVVPSTEPLINFGRSKLDGD